MATGRASNDLGELEVGQMLISVHMNSTVQSVFGTDNLDHPPYKKFGWVLDGYRVDSTFADENSHRFDEDATSVFIGMQHGPWA